ncbi:hypothetical protein FRC01_010506, partial [Tulasnella sp. 417]
MADSAPQIPKSADATLTKTAAKKADKNAEKAAKFAAKQAAKAAAAQAPPPATAGAGSSGKKKKADTEQKVEATPYVNKTPKGEKKDMTEPMAAGYDPIAVESAWYEWWHQQGYFKPEFTADGKVKPAGLFVLPCPPPNVTG